MKFNMTRAIGYFNFGVGLITLINTYGQPFGIAVVCGLMSLVLGCFILGINREE